MKTSHVDVGYVMNMDLFFGTTHLKDQPYIKDLIWNWKGWTMICVPKSRMDEVDMPHIIQNLGK